MMSGIETRPNRLPWPPLIYIGAVAIAIILNWVYPLPWLRGPFAEFLLGLGLVIIVGAVIIDVAAMRAMTRARTTIMPHRGSEHLVTGGPFSFTRNPIYLGNTLIMFGLGLISGILWFFVLGLVAAFLTQKLAIEREEKHLEAKFGKKFRDYAKRVRRWI